MNAHAYTEDRLVEQPAIGLFAEPGWQTASAMEEQFGVGDTLGRENLGEVVLTPRLRAAPERLTKAERDEVKKVARQLLDRLHKLLVLNWRQKIQSRARIRLAIADALDEGLPRAYTKDLYQSKCAALFEHVYDSYLGDGASVYRDAA